MKISNAAIAAIAALCVTAGAAGVYVATGAGTGPASAPIETVLAAADVQSHRALQPVAVGATVARQPIAPPRAADVAARQPAPVRRVVVTEQPSEESPAWPQAPQRAEPTFTTGTSEAWSPRAESTTPAEASDRSLPPATPDFVELTIPDDAVLGLQVETPLTSESATVEDEVVAQVTRDLRVGDRVAIPSGARAFGEVTIVGRGGRLRERARLGVRFTSVVLANGTRIPLLTETIYRDGASPGGESAAKIGGGAIGGAIVGGILGGARGAVIGGSVGAGAGTAAVMVGGRNAATLPAGTPITVRLVEPATMTVPY